MADPLVVTVFNDTNKIQFMSTPENSYIFSGREYKSFKHGAINGVLKKKKKKAILGLN